MPDPHPNLREDDSANTGLVCFLNDKRMCGADCMAYQPAAPATDPEYRDQQWPHCMLLVAAHRGGKHLVVLAAQGAELLKGTKNAAADAARANQPQPVLPKTR